MRVYLYIKSYFSSSVVSHPPSLIHSVGHCCFWHTSKWENGNAGHTLGLAKASLESQDYSQAFDVVISQHDTQLNFLFALLLHDVHFFYPAGDRW